MFDLLEWLTGAKPLVSAEEEDWQQIKAHAGMREWPCDVAIQELDPGPQGAPSAAGTFRRAAAKGLITYNPALSSDPLAFVATMAHELAHFLLSEISEPPPGGVENLEFATDMAAVFLGFGVFLVNSAFTSSNTLSGTSMRWSVRRQGYLSEPQLINALAIFTLLLGCEPRPISRELNGHLRRLYKLGLRDVEKSGRLQVLREIVSLPSVSRDIPAPMPTGLETAKRVGTSP